MNPESVLCIIPARGGSRRVPGKNLVSLAGKPLIVYSIEHALGARLVGRVVVSTDSEEIAEVSAAHGAEVVIRPADISGDNAASEAALLHVLEYMALQEDYRPELIVFLQCTSPLRTPDDIDRAIRTIELERADSLLSVVEKKMFLWTEDCGEPKPLNYDLESRPRSQELAPVYLENGSIYVSTRQLLESTGNRLGGKIAFLTMPSESDIDIDTPDELERCRAVFERRRDAV